MGAEEREMLEEKKKRAQAVMDAKKRLGISESTEDTQKSTVSVKVGDKTVFLDADGAPKIRGVERVVPIARVRPNPWNYNEQSDFIFEKLKLSIQQFGFTEPLTVRSANQDGPLISDKGKQIYEIVGGEHRWKAAKELGMKEIPIRDIGAMSDDDLKKFMIVLNETKGRPNQDTLAAILSDLDKRGVSLEILPYDRAELDSLISMGDFDWDSLPSSQDSASAGDHAQEDEEDYEGLYEVLCYDDMTEEEDRRFAARLKTYISLRNIPSRKGWLAISDLLDYFYKTSGTKEPKIGRE